MPEPREIDNLAAHLDLHETARPTHPAIVHADGEITHAAFAARVRAAAAALEDQGVSRGTFVALALADTPDHLVALFALMRLGAVAVPVDHRWSAEETRALCAHFEATHILTEPGAPQVGPAPLTIPKDAPDPGRALPFAPGGPMVLSLSSGTTGRPTGPLATHAMMRARIENQLAALTFNQHDRHLLATPLYFGGGRAFALSHLVIGATLILHPPPYAPEALAEAVGRHGATTAFLVPTLIRRLLALPDAALAPMRGLRLLVSSGAPLHPPERAEIARRVTPGFMEYFASTEGGGIAVLPPGAWEDHPDSVGRAAFGVELEIVDADHRPLPPGEEGLVRYRGPGVATAFHADPERSAESFADGWFLPGDVGRLSPDGWLTLLGRAKNVIIRGGVNIHPAEIERALEGHPAIREAAVIGVPHAELGESLRAVLVPEGAAPEPQALRDWLAPRLAPYKIPADWRIAEALPRNAAGKVVLAEVKDRWGGPD